MKQRGRADQSAFYRPCIGTVCKGLFQRELLGNTRLGTVSSAWHSASEIS